MNYRVKFLPSGREAVVNDGATVYDAALALGMSLKADCGGKGTCGTCVVKIEAGSCAPTPHPSITPDREKKGYRLACRAAVTGDLAVYIPEESTLPACDIDFETIVLTEDDAKRRDALAGLVPSPLVRRLAISLPRPTLEDNLGDMERLARGLKLAGFPGEPTCALGLMKRLPALLRASGWRVDVSIADAPRGPEIAAVSAACGAPPVGLALDLGTTTVVGELVDLCTGACIRRAAAYNRQISCGTDIISRIIATGREGGSERLRALALETIEKIVERLLAHAGLDRGGIAAAAVAGNTTMVHLLLGLDAEQIRLDPYIPAANRLPILRAAETGLPIAQGAPVLFAPGIGSYVGGDVLAGVLACGMERSDDLTLFIDAGTNGEIVLGNREWMMGCACSTGPAFEGIGIACGMMAAPGAVEAVAIESRDEAPRVTTIAGAPARGLCGSGMIDLMACLFRRGVLDRKGVLDRSSGCPRIEERGRHAAYLVRREGEKGAAKEIYLTDVDLKKLLLTKAAIQAAIRTLLAEAGLAAGEIRRVVIAGRLGEAIDASNAIAIGMLPDLPQDRFEYAGNGSLWGANLLLLSREARGEILRLADRITYLDLSTNPGYMGEFVASLFIPHTDAA